MDLQNTFYVLGIIFMGLSILILFGIVVLLFYIRKKVGDLHEFIEIQVNEFTTLTLDPVRKVTKIAKSFMNQGEKHVDAKKRD